MNIKEAINNILNGASLEDELYTLIHEKRVCKNVGPRKKRKSKRGRTYWVRERVCRGRPDPTRSRRVKRSLIGKKQQRSRAQRSRWRNIGQSKRTVIRHKSRRR